MDYQDILDTLSKKRSNEGTFLSKNEIAVIAYLSTSTDYISAEKLWIKLKQAGLKISVGTVYLILKRLVEEKIVDKQAFQKIAIYALKTDHE